MLKAGSPWRDVRLRQAVNVAINREDLIQYAAKGNGVIVPALLAVNILGMILPWSPMPSIQSKPVPCYERPGIPTGWRLP